MLLKGTRRSESPDAVLDDHGPRHFFVRSPRLYEDDSRLDATTYAGGSAEVLEALERSGFPLEPIATVCGTMWHPVQTQARSNFKRIYTSADMGVPFVSSRAMFGFPLKPEKFLSRAIPKLTDLSVAEGWIVVSRSGTVGNAVYVSRLLSDCAITDHAIRLEPTGVAAGYLYAFLCSRPGRTLLAKGKFGATVEELEPKHIGAIPLPRLGHLEQEVHESIVRAYDVRDTASETLAAVEAELYTLLDVEPFSETDVEYIRPPVEGPRAFRVHAGDLADRLDASHHVPVVRSAVAKLKEGRYGLTTLGDVVERIYVPPRFRRLYVEREFGVPLLQGSQLPLMRPYNLKYISHSRTKNLERWLLEPGWVLVTCSGTIGRLAVTTAAQGGWAASQHILRIIPGNEGFHPGFLWAYLGSAYGQHQLKAKIYGGVVDELTERDTAAVAIPNVPRPKQVEIGEVVLEAYAIRDQAAQLEEAAIERVEAALSGRRLRLI